MVTSIASRCCRILFLLGSSTCLTRRLRILPHPTCTVTCVCNLVYQMYLMESPTSRCTSRQQHNGRITQTHFEWRGAQNEPRIKLPEGPFVHSCQASKKAWGYVLHGFLYQRKCLVNDMGNGPHHLTDILYDPFYITAL